MNRTVWVLGLSCALLISGFQEDDNSELTGFQEKPPSEVFRNSEIEWEVLPMGKLHPRISDDLLQEFIGRIRRSEELGELLKNPDCKAFAYVADCIGKGETYKLNSFCLDQSSNSIHSTCGKLQVRIDYSQNGGELVKSVSYPLLMRDPYQGDVHRYGNIQLDMDKIWKGIVKEADLAKDSPRLNEKQLMNHVGKWGRYIGDFGLYIKGDEAVAEIAYRIKASVENGESFEDIVLPVHIALSHWYFPQDYLGLPNEKGADVWINGLTVSIVYDFVTKEWIFEYPDFEAQKCLLVHKWAVFFDKLRQIERNVQERPLNNADLND